MIQFFTQILILTCMFLSAHGEEIVIRVAHSPNITHAQALVARAMSRRGNYWFEERLGPGVRVQWFAFNAGRGSVEGFFAKTIDLAYIGPSPALNAFIRSRGKEVRILAGAMNGGEALVVQGDHRIRSASDFREKRIATPQLGNTQDVSCRAWLAQQGFQVTLAGGDVLVIPTANPDQLSLFKQNKIDAVWTVEPWVSRLLREAGGKVFFEDRKAVTTVLACRYDFLRTHEDLAYSFKAAHQELTKWISENSEEAQQLIVEELTVETGYEMPRDLVSEAWGRLLFTTKVDQESLETYVVNARKVGLLKLNADLSELVIKTNL